MSVILKDVSKMMSFAASRRNLDFRFEIGADVEDDLVVLGDPGRVRQILTNLLTNSIKFTHQGFVRLSVTRERETSDTTEIKFVVEDTGIGMDGEVQKRLFQPFSQGDASTARKFGGTGLGLTICKNLLELMHGRMTLVSKVGEGTCMAFCIPFNKPHGQATNLVKIEGLSARLQSEMSVSCNSSDIEQLVGTPPNDMLLNPRDKGKSPHRQQSYSAMTPTDDLSPAERSKIHVLVVEDNPINQQIAIKTIKKLGFGVTAAWNGKDALDYMTAAQNGQKKRPNIILMDVQMPVIDGYKCTHLLRHHVPHRAYVSDVPIVAMTASAIQGDKEKCRKAGMDDYLAKPVKAKMLEKMLVRWSKTKRQSPTPYPSSDASDCSEAAEYCSNSEIPGIALDYADAEDYTNSRRIDADGEKSEDTTGESPYSVPTPRPATREGSREPCDYPSFQRPNPQSPKVELQAPVRRVETDELAMQSRDDKLIDAAGGVAVTPMSHAHTPIMESGDSLTEANVAKLQRAESTRRRQS